MADDKTTYVPADFDYLDPDRPDIVYESDLSDDDKEKYAAEIEAQHARQRDGKTLGPPWTVTLEDGTELTFGEGGKPA